MYFSITSNGTWCNLGMGGGWGGGNDGVALHQHSRVSNNDIFTTKVRYRRSWWRPSNVCTPIRNCTSATTATATICYGCGLPSCKLYLRPLMHGDVIRIAHVSISWGIKIALIGDALSLTPQA